MEPRSHWEHVYGSKASTAVSWYQPHAEHSVMLIRDAGVSPDAAVIDVGGGASTLVDDLLDAGFSNLTVLDLSETALNVARERLGSRSHRVKWRAENVLDAQFDVASFDLWHDRAVFHFLTSAADRTQYVRQVARAVKPGGFVLVATFAEDGPTQCSGLPICRYSPDELHAEFGDTFTLLRHEKEAHQTPAGAIQQFVYCLCRKG